MSVYRDCITWSKTPALLEEKVGLGIRRKRQDAEAVRVTCDHVERADADAAG